MKKAKKILICSLAGFFLLFLIICFGAGNFMVNYAIKRSGDGANRNVALEIDTSALDAVQTTIMENKAIRIAATKEFIERVPEKSTEIKSNDGLTLKGFYHENPASEDWVITIHGYRSKHTSMRSYAQSFYDHGYNVLLPDLRSCGESQGDYLGMGWLDRMDILLWIDWILQRSPNARIIIHGVSMGGATTMMVSGEKTPANVIGFIEDCGYTSVWDIFSSELKLRFHLPKFPIMYSANICAKIKAKYLFSEASSIKQLKKSEKPMLFIHGTADDFIPFDMMDIEYQAKAGNNNRKLAAPGAGHGEALDVLGQTYWDEVYGFIDSL